MVLKKWEWMVKPTPQNEWIDKRGMLLWIAFFAIELGAGMYFVSIFLNYPLGMLIGYLICLVIGGGAHFLYLGKPLRFWRSIISGGWKTSWVSRGMYFIGLFTVVGAVHLGLSDWSGAAQSGAAYGLGISMAVIAVLVTIYGGFVFSYVNAIPLWNTALIPILFVVGSFWGGAELAFAINLEDAAAESWIQILLPSYIFLLVIYILTVRHGIAAGKHAIKEMMWGSMAPLFYIGVVGIGILLPLSAVITNLTGEVSTVLVVIAVAGGLIGDLSMRYCILKCGYYAPLLPVSSN